MYYKLPVITLIIVSTALVANASTPQQTRDVVSSITAVRASIFQIIHDIFASIKTRVDELLVTLCESVPSIVATIELFRSATIEMPLNAINSLLSLTMFFPEIIIQVKMIQQFLVLSNTTLRTVDQFLSTYGCTLTTEISKLITNVFETILSRI